MPIINGHYEFAESDWPKRKFSFLGEPVEPNNMEYFLKCRKWADEHGQGDGQCVTTKSYTLLENLPFFIEKWQEGLEIWNPDILRSKPLEKLTDEEQNFEDTWVLLINCCKIAKMDYKEFVDKTKEFIDKDNVTQSLNKVRAGWNIVARLRLICDVAIMLWTRASNCAVPCTGQPDCIGNIIYSDKLKVLGLSPEAKGFLEILNDSANFYKHPKSPSDLAMFGEPKVYLCKKDGQKIAQPVADLVAGTNRFMAAIFNAILPPKPGV